MMNDKYKNLTVGKKLKNSFSLVVLAINTVFLLSIIGISVMNLRIYKNGGSIKLGLVITVVMVLAGAGAAILCFALAKMLTQNIVEPVKELQAAVQKLKEGELNIDIAYEGGDELGELAADLREACAQMHTVVTDSGYLLGEMAEGRFNIATQVESSYVGDFRNVILSMRKLNRQLDATLHQIAESSSQVKVGSEQLAQSAQDLAEGATEQAGAVEELTATIESVTHISEESAENATTAASAAKKAAENAGRNREEINELTGAMARITETSKEIENIIAAIEDIASQTNLLSLNASIEAARAGEAGRGFAVVADQIGKLAADSAQSAVNTRDLIGKALEEIEAGNRIVENTMEAIGTVLADMESFAGMASGAAEASRVQADMLKQIEAGIEQISSVVQSNSASAEETSAVSEELSAQAITLEEMIEKFELR